LTKEILETADAMSALLKRGTEENVELCTTLGREAAESHGRNREIIETKPGNTATMRSHVFRFPEPEFLPSRPATNTAIVGRNSPPWTARYHIDTRYEMKPRKSSWPASSGPYLLRCWLTKGLIGTDDPSTTGKPAGNRGESA